MDYYHVYLLLLSIVFFYYASCISKILNLIIILLAIEMVALSFYIMVYGSEIISKNKIIISTREKPSRVRYTRTSFKCLFFFILAFLKKLIIIIVPLV